MPKKSKAVEATGRVPEELRPGYDLLKSLAGYPTRSVQMGKHTVNSRIVLIQREASGRVIGSTERREQSEYTDLVGDWLD
jgi:hypothetical protein